MTTPESCRLVVGSRFAGLVIEREIGRGGAGTVYLARDEKLDRHVALKVLHQAGLAEDTAAAERFRIEAQLAAKLEHPAIIPIYATGVEDGVAYISMRYIPGRNLADLIMTTGPRPIEEAIRLLWPIAAALDYAADHQIIHRDVKPGNILIDESVTPARALLGDFGIARASEATHHTAFGGWVGTPEYIAPEILKNEAATARADQYSLACVLAETISGTSLFKRSNTAATITAQVIEIPNLTNISNLNRQTATALSIALAKNPADRYTTSIEFVHAVQQSIGLDPDNTPDTMVRKRQRRKLTRHAKIVGGITLSLVAITAGLTDFLNVKNTLLGSNTPTITQPAPTKPTPAKPTIDILILGNDFNVDNAWWYRNGKQSRSKKGLKGAEIMKLALLLHAKTAGLKIRIRPLIEAGSCVERAQAALKEIPSKAIIIMDSPCVKASIMTLNKVRGSVPPTYVLASGYKDDNVYSIKIMTAPLASLAAATPPAMRWLHDEYGSSADRTYIVLRQDNLYGMGQFALKNGNDTCLLLDIGDTREFPELLRVTHQYELKLGLGEHGVVRVVPIDYATMTTKNPISITGTKAGDDDLAREIREQVLQSNSTSSAGGCYVLPDQTSQPGYVQWAAQAIRFIIEHDRDAYIYGSGDPRVLYNPNIQWNSTEEDTYEAIQSNAHVWLINTLPSPPPGSDAYRLALRLFYASDFNTYPYESDYNYLVETALLIGTQPVSSGVSTSMLGYLTPQQWAKGEPKNGLAPAFVRFNPLTGRYGAAMVYVWHQSPGDTEPTWEASYSGPDSLTRAP